jgi:hypothetical protein
MGGGVAAALTFRGIVGGRRILRYLKPWKFPD